jgi:hypothetical protein
MSARAEISGDDPLALALRTSQEATETIEMLVLALEKARNTFSGIGLDSIGRDICDAPLAKVRGQ